jgi:tetratricopeptide (TPR) repeat protein
MKHTFVTLPASKQADAAPGYNDKGMQMPVIPKDAGSAGVLKSSLPDMIKYLQYQLRESDSAVKLTHQPTWGDTDNTAIGLNWWLKTNFDDQLRIWTSGGTFGQACYLCFYPGRQFGLVILTNENDREAEDRISGLAKAIYNELFFTASQRAAQGFGFSSAINKLWDALDKSGFEHAIQVADSLRGHAPSFKLIEDEVNVWGYDQLFKKQVAKAVAIFQLNVHLYPQSPNTYDSLAEACEAAGDATGAIKNYQRELELAPGNKQIREHLAKLVAGRN